MMKTINPQKSSKFAYPGSFIRRIVLIFFTLFIMPYICFAENVSLAWDPYPNTNPTGFKLFYGFVSRQYLYSIDVGNQTVYTVPNLEVGKTYYFAVTAYNNNGIESEYSEELTHTVQQAPTPLPQPTVVANNPLAQVDNPTPTPTHSPTIPILPSSTPTNTPTTAPSATATRIPATATSTQVPTTVPTATPTSTPTTAPSATATRIPATATSTQVPTTVPTATPTCTPTTAASAIPTQIPATATSTRVPTTAATATPTTTPTTVASSTPTYVSFAVTATPTATATKEPTTKASATPTTTPTPIPTVDSSANSGILTSSEFPDHIIVCDSLSSYVGLSGSNDIDAANDRELVIRWFFHYTDVRDIYIYVEVDGASLVYLGRTGNADAQYFDWKSGAANLDPAFQNGPQGGHSYKFYVYPLTKSGFPWNYGPFINLAPVQFIVK